MTKLSEKSTQIMAYNGEKKGYTLENYVRIHVNPHAILDGQVEHG